MELLCLFIIFYHFYTKVNAQEMPNDCKCWIAHYRRTPCNGDVTMSEDECANAGCCFYQDPVYRSSPACFAKTGNCPTARCHVSPERRRKCDVINRDVIPRSVCESHGCCYSDVTRPYCYASSEDTHVTTTIQPINSMFNNHPPREPLRSLHTVGPFRFIKSCEDKRARYWGWRVTREQCHRFRGCWDYDVTSTSVYRCYRATWFWLNWPVKNPSWGSWSLWSECSGSRCNVGSQRRTRSCNDDYLPNKSCSGASYEEQSCRVSCPGASWGSWSMTSCSDNCSPGSQLKYRSCFDGATVVLNENCEGGNTGAVQSSSCNEDFCTSYSTYAVGQCSNHCSRMGRKVRSRTCIGTGYSPPQCLTIEERCFDENLCVPTWGSWSTWGGCVGESCNTGTQTRTRGCQNGDVATKMCIGEANEERSCIVPCGGTWGGWNPGVCRGDSCTPGVSTDTRNCFELGAVVANSNCEGGALGSTRETPCNTDRCSDYSPFVFQQCSNNCRSGVKVGSRRCLDGGVSPVACLSTTLSCFDEVLCVPSWSDWSQWGACGGAECTSATRTRTRTCPDALPTKPCPGQPSKDENCLSACPSAGWSAWVPGPCMGPDISCSPGTRTETRTCRSRGNVVDDVFCAGGTPSSTRQTNCQEDLCTSYSAFTFTSCTNVCRTGTRSGVRSCIASGTVPAGCLTKQESCFDETACGTIDLMFVLDGMQSVTSQNFIVIKNWMQSFIPRLNLQDGKIRFGLTRYTGSVVTDIELGEPQNLPQINNVISSLPFTTQSTKTTLSITSTINNNFNSVGSRFPASRRLVVVVTDGLAQETMSDVNTSVQLAQTNKVEIISVAVGPFANLATLGVITGDPTFGNIFQARTFNLNSISSPLFNKLFNP
ncbi:coadhesin-like isoform X2 [Ciona intestinalis]